ncbi:MAG TPA: endonuclease III [Bacteroidia bacterium]|nr:endonuclease III [Bacteroidia bacterium]HNT80171.1 endonuclease III [Bacteroidia bacterium]
MTTTERYENILAYFLKHKPIAETELEFKNPFQLLVAVILSAQCTDKRVNLVTPDLFRHFPNPESLSKARQEDVFEVIKSISYPNNKSKHLVGMAQMLLSEFNGVVPENVEDLQKLPGVGRKTANVIASVVYDKPAMAVDTHVYRVAARLGLTRNAKTPLAAEKQLVKNIPDDLIPLAHHWLILHGRYICKARKPLCSVCGLTEFCRYYKKISK